MEASFPIINQSLFSASDHNWNQLLMLSVSSNIFFDIYFRFLAGLILIPFRLNFSGLMGRGILALIFTFFFVTEVTSPVYLINHGIFINMLIGILISLSLLFPFWSFLLFFEIAENMRGMNYAVFFTSEDFSSNKHFEQGIKVILIVFFLEHGFLLELLKQLFHSLEVNYNNDYLAKNLAHLSLESLTLGFQLLLPILGFFLIIQLLFMPISKLYPQNSFFSELFFIKMIILLLVLRTDCL